MTVLRLQLPHVLVRVLDVVVTHFVEDLLEVGDRLLGTPLVTPPAT